MIGKKYFSSFFILFLSFFGAPDISDADDESRISFTNVSAIANIVSGIEGGHGVYIADVNGDDYDDVYVTNCGESATPDLLYINQQNGQFSEQAYSRGVYDYNIYGCSHGAVFGDTDKDGDYDLYNGNTGERNHLYRNNGSGYFSDVTNSSGILNYGGDTRGCIMFYGDTDFRLDIFNVNYGYESLEYNEYYMANGNNSFTFKNNALYNNDYELEQGVTSGDFDNDGDIDIYICRRNNPNQLYVNDGTGNYSDQAAFLRVAFSGYGDGATFGDIDGDGNLDLILAGTGNSKIMIMKYSRNIFNDVSASSNIAGDSYMTNLVDLDLDGDLDLIVARWRNDVNKYSSYYLNDGSGVFTFGGNFFMAAWDDYDARSVACFDYDNDGDLDVLFILNRGSAKFFRNNTNLNRWLKFKLYYRNTAGAFGTKITLYDEDHLGDDNYLVAHREAVSTFGYLAQNSPVVHFGLPKFKTYFDARVQFPDGVTWNFLSLEKEQVIDFTNMATPLFTPTPTNPVYNVPLRRVEVSWIQNDPDSIFDYFELWRSENDGEFELLTVTSLSYYHDSNVTEESNYKYIVRSVDIHHRVSDYSNVMEIEIPRVPELSTIGLLLILFLLTVFMKSRMIKSKIRS